MNMTKENGNDQSAADFVANQLPLGEQTKLSNKELNETLSKHGIPYNDRKSMEIRRILPFTDNMIIPEVDMTAKVRREKSPMMFTKLRSKEEFEAYEFTEKNFRKLEQATIDEVVAKARKKIDGCNNVVLLKLLTILDTILVTAKDYDVYQPIKRRRLMAYIREPKDAVNNLIGALVEMGIMSYKGRFDDIRCLFCVHRTSADAKPSVISVDFERAQHNRDNGPKKVLTDDLDNDSILEASERESRMLDENIKHFLGDKASESNNNIKISQADEGFENESLETLLKAIATHNTIQQKHFHEEEAKLAARIKELETEALNQEEVIKTVEAQMKKLMDENEQLKKDQRIYAENIKDYKGFRKTVKDRVEAVMDHFNARVLEAVMKNNEPQNKDRLVRQMTGITYDASKSILNMLTMDA
jgi:uncharacterized coiled-coil protein SlyX